MGVGGGGVCVGVGVEFEGAGRGFGDAMVWFLCAMGSFSDRLASGDSFSCKLCAVRVCGSRVGLDSR